MEELYCDGGVIKRNPSPFGGTWAWCLVDQSLRIIEKSGLVLPTASYPLVTNNVTELYAALEALRSRPDGWCGTIFTDSFITILRIGKRKKQAKLNCVPQELIDLLKVTKERLGHYRAVLLAGHPTRNDLLAGSSRAKRLPVSRHNVWCDNACTAQAQALLSQRGDNYHASIEPEESRVGGREDSASAPQPGA